MSLDSSGVLSAPCLHPKSTSFCLVWLSLYYRWRQLNLGSADHFVFLLLVSLSQGCPGRMLAFSPNLWSFCGDRPEAEFYSLLQLLTVPTLQLLMIMLGFVNSDSLPSTDSAKIHQNLLSPSCPGSAAILIN